MWIKLPNLSTILKNTILKKKHNIFYFYKIHSMIKIMNTVTNTCL